MVHYALICDEGHHFDGWFRDSATFERQSEERLISCPFCASTRVTRGVMAPHVTRSGRDSASPELLRQIIRQIHEKVASSAEDVGDRFSEEARAIEEGVAERRPIRGRATFEEAKALLEDGIEILPIPDLPHDN